MSVFEISLIFEPSGDEMTVTYDTDVDDPEALLNGEWPDGFTDEILSNISIVPISYE